MNDEWQKNWLNSSVIILHSRLLVILTSDSWLLDSVTSDNPCLASVKYLSDGVEQIVSDDGRRARPLVAVCQAVAGSALGTPYVALIPKTHVM